MQPQLVAFYGDFQSLQARFLNFSHLRLLIGKNLFYSEFIYVRFATNLDQYIFFVSPTFYLKMTSKIVHLVTRPVVVLYTFNFF